jgi:putative alpha-1,2-mannosidase
LVALSPDNLDRKGWYKGGFDPKIKNIAEYSHIDAWTMSVLLVMPTTSDLNANPGKQDMTEKGYRSCYSNDIATPGYYAVQLDDYGIKAELTATTRTGFQKYKFPRSGQTRILFD